MKCPSRLARTSSSIVGEVLHHKRAGAIVLDQTPLLHARTGDEQRRPPLDEMDRDLLLDAERPHVQ
eukprot:242047-Pyramimonas_sp.AAC.1